jgi:hypothetical protein
MASEEALDALMNGTKPGEYDEARAKRARKKRADDFKPAPPEVVLSVAEQYLKNNPEETTKLYQVTLADGSIFNLQKILPGMLMGTKFFRMGIDFNKSNELPLSPTPEEIKQRETDALEMVDLAICISCVSPRVVQTEPQSGEVPVSRIPWWDKNILWSEISRKLGWTLEVKENARPFSQTEKE